MPIAPVDRHLFAIAALAGIILDLLGGLYLAFDLLGGRQGPLRTVSRAVTYSVLFGVVLGIAFGFPFGVIAGPGMGVLLGLEFREVNVAETHGDPTRDWGWLLFGVGRGILLGLAAWPASGFTFAAAFALCCGVGIVPVYLLGFSPIREYAKDDRPRVTGRAFVSAAARGVAVGIAGGVAGVLVGRGATTFMFGVEVGIVVGFANVVVTTFSPIVEWWADASPGRHLGVVGAVLVFLGFLLQSVQYIAVLFNVPTR